MRPAHDREGFPFVKISASPSPLVTALTGMGPHGDDDGRIGRHDTNLRFSPHGTAFLTDAIVLQRYPALPGQFERVIGVGRSPGERPQEGLAPSPAPPTIRRPRL